MTSLLFRKPKWLRTYDVLNEYEAYIKIKHIHYLDLEKKAKRERISQKEAFKKFRLSLLKSKIYPRCKSILNRTPEPIRGDNKKIILPRTLTDRLDNMKGFSSVVSKRLYPKTNVFLSNQMSSQ